MKPESFQNNFCREAVSHQDARFPLTLTLSPEEREQRLDAFSFSRVDRANPVALKSMGLRKFLPLLRGEGWGEGKTINQNSILAIVL